MAVAPTETLFVMIFADFRLLAYVVIFLADLFTIVFVLLYLVRYVSSRVLINKRFLIVWDDFDYLTNTLRYAGLVSVATIVVTKVFVFKYQNEPASLELFFLVSGALLTMFWFKMHEHIS